MLVLSNSRGTTLAMWDDQLGPLGERCGCCGTTTGARDLPRAAGPYRMEHWPRPARPARWAGPGAGSFCGLSLGGWSGVDASHAPERIDRLALF